MKRSKKILATGLIAGTLAATPIFIEGDVVDPSIVNRDWNVDHILQDDGSVQASFKQKQINYYDDGQWKTIRTDFDEKLTHYRVDEAPFIVEAPKYADGVAKFIANNEWDISTDSEIQEDDIEMSILAIGAEHVRGEFEFGDLGLGSEHQYVVYKDAYPEINADLIYYVYQGVVPELRKIVRFNGPIKDDVELEFDIEYSEDVEAEKDGDDVIISKKDGDSRRTIDINDLYAWDQWENRIKIDGSFRSSGRKSILVKEIKPNDLSGLKYPIYTDASLSVSPNGNPETVSVDGYIDNSVASETWSQITAGNGTSAIDNDTSVQIRIIATTTTDEYEYLSKAKLLFDTSSIGSGYYVDSATLNMTPVFTGLDDFGMSVSIVSATTASNTSLSVNDFNKNTYGTTRLASDKSVASMTDEVEFSMPLNTAGIANIDMNGVSKFGAIPDFVLDGGPVWGNSYDTRLILYSAESANDPSLDITYFPTPAQKKIIPIF